jgi:serine/threonine protein kinase
MAYKEKLLLELFRQKPSHLLLGEELGRGAHGVVHIGKYEDRLFAVKKIHKLLFDEDRSMDEIKRIITDFKNEADILAVIRHPHVVRSFGAFYDPEKREPLLMMELMDMDLRKYVENSEHRPTLNVAKQLIICLQIALGLQYLHHLSPPLAHRDLNDKNVLLAKDGTVKIGDLGQSKFIDRKIAYFESKVPGSIPFMPPETFWDKPHYTESVDIFSLGVLAVEVAIQSFPSVGMVGIGVVPEVERRANDLKKMGASHPLMPLVRKCLRDSYKERPDIDHVVFSILKIFENDSSDLESLKVQMATVQERGQAEKRELEKQLSDKERELEECKNAQSRIQSHVEHLIKEVEAKDAELQQTRKDKSRIQSHVEHLIKEVEAKDAELQQTSKEKEQCIEEMKVLRSEAATNKLKKEKHGVLGEDVFYDAPEHTHQNKSNAKSSTLPCGLKLGQPEEYSQFTAAKREQTSDSGQLAESLTEADSHIQEARDVDKPVVRVKSRLPSDSKALQLGFVSVELKQKLEKRLCHMQNKTVEENTFVNTSTVPSPSTPAQEVLSAQDPNATKVK